MQSDSISFGEFLISGGITETGWEVLTYLLNFKKANKYEITNYIKRAYSGVYQNIKKLLMMKMIKITDVVPSKRNPNINTEYYSITNMGFFLTLGLRNEIWKDIDKIASIHNEKLIIFNKWDIFTPFFKNSIVWKLKYLLTNILIALKITEQIKNKLQLTVTRNLFYKEYGIYIQYDPSVIEKSVMEQINKELILYIIQYCMDSLKIYPDIYPEEQKNYFKQFVNSANQILIDKEMREMMINELKSEINLNKKLLDEEEKYHKLLQTFSNQPEIE